MAAALGDLIQFTDHQTYLGEELMNVYYYRVVSITGLTGNYLELMNDEFISSVISKVLDIQNDAVLHTTLEARNLSNNIDIWETVVNDYGDDPSDGNLNSPSYLSLGFQLIRESLVTRNGYKRYAGLIDSRIAGNTYSPPTGTIAPLETALAADMYLSAALVAEPVIVKRPFTPPVGTTYQYASIGSAVYRGMGTQNTRKP